MSTANPFDVILMHINQLQQQNTELLHLVKKITESNPTSNLKDWMIIEELINYLPNKPARQTVYSWVHRRLIPFHKPHGKHLIFSRTEIDFWIESKLKNKHDPSLELVGLKTKGKGANL